MFNTDFSPNILEKNVLSKLFFTFLGIQKNHFNFIIFIMNNYFSTNLKYLRKKQGLTQHQLADIVGKKKSIVGNYEKGSVEPSMETIQKIADYFTTSWISLLGTDFRLTSDTKPDDHNHATTATINELVAIRKENAQKDKKIEKLEAQIQVMSEQIKALKQNQIK